MRRFFIYLFSIIGVLGVITNIILSIIGPRYFDDIWKLYNENSVPFIGLFTILGALVTLFIFSETAKATENAAKSLKLTQETLKTTMESNRKDDFIKQFILLLELHGKSHDTLADYLNNNEVITSNGMSIINWNMTIKDASDKLFQNHIFSPYMRLVYRILKYIDENFYRMSDKDFTVLEVDEEKKQYTSIVRSTIRNDVLFFIAINSLNESFSRYRELLEKFNFFEHLNPVEIGSNLMFDLSTYNKTLPALKYHSLICRNLIKESLNYYLYSPLAKSNRVEKFELELPYSFIINVMRAYNTEQYKNFLSKINGKMSPLPINEQINEELRAWGNFKDCKYYIFSSPDADNCFNDAFNSNKFKLISNKRKSLSRFWVEIEKNKLSKKEFCTKYSNKHEGICFSTDSYNFELQGNFITCSYLYDLCIEAYRYKKLQESISSGKLKELSVAIITDKIKSTDLVKLGALHIEVKEENENTIINFNL
ncbi:putative phage abortive infection protein [Providencia stuartii]|uniref:putative phage abortive infection protein n=1 Tax=Providencia stuartii TaxID=588 RepID=UPI00300C93E9